MGVLEVLRLSGIGQPPRWEPGLPHDAYGAALNDSTWQWRKLRRIPGFGQVESNCSAEPRSVESYIFTDASRALAQEPKTSASRRIAATTSDRTCACDDVRRLITPSPADGPAVRLRSSVSGSRNSVLVMISHETRIGVQLKGVHRKAH